MYPYEDWESWDPAKFWGWDLKGACSPHFPFKFSQFYLLNSVCIWFKILLSPDDSTQLICFGAVPWSLWAPVKPFLLLDLVVYLVFNKLISLLFPYLVFFERKRNKEKKSSLLGTGRPHYCQLGYLRSIRSKCQQMLMNMFVSLCTLQAVKLSFVFRAVKGTLVVEHAIFVPTPTYSCFFWFWLTESECYRHQFCSIIILFFFRIWNSATLPVPWLINPLLLCCVLYTHGSKQSFMSKFLWSSFSNVNPLNYRPVVIAEEMKCRLVI